MGRIDGKGVVFTLLATLCYGLMPIFSGIAYQAGLTPFNLLWIRFFGGTAVLFLGYLALGKINRLKLDRKTFLLFAFTLALPYWGTIASKFVAFTCIPKGVCQAIFYIYPFFVILYTELTIDHKLVVKPLLCYTLIFAGVLLAVDLSDTRITTLGISLSVLSAFTHAFYVVSSKRKVFSGIGSMERTFYTLLCGFVYSSIAIPIAGFEPIRFQPYGWFSIAGLVLISSIASVALFNQGIKTLDGGIAAMICSMEPVVTIIIETVTGLGHYNPRQYVGIVLIPLGICLQILVSKRDKKGEINE